MIATPAPAAETSSADIPRADAARADTARADVAAVLTTRDLSIHYGARSAIKDIDLAILPGTIVSVIGPNGAGKSTLLKALAGVTPPSHGEVRYRDQVLRRPHPDITSIPQRSGAEWTFPISVIETVLLGLSRRASRLRRFNGEERQRARQALDTVGMLPLADVQIGALSGGQQQRVFLARALVACGAVLLLDEPFTGVDVPTQDLFLELFAGFRAQGVTIVFATHDLAQAARTADRAVLVNNTVLADGPPGEILTPEILATTFQGRILMFDQHGSAR